MCSHCYAEIPNESRYCVRCGSAVSDVREADVAGAASSVETPETSTNVPTRILPGSPQRGSILDMGDGPTKRRRTARSLAVVAVIAAICTASLIAFHYFSSSRDCSFHAFRPRANLSGCALAGQSFAGENLTGANLKGADLEDANFNSSVLTNANLKGANLKGATLYEANLSFTNLSGANLESSDLTEANLTGANLRNADLLSANLHGTNLTSVDIEYVDFQYANLTSAILDFDNVSDSLWLDTMCPDGTSSNSHISSAGLPTCAGDLTPAPFIP